MMLFRLLLEKLNAFLTQSNSDFYRIFFKYEFLWSRQKIRHNLQGTDWFISVFDFRAHKSAHLYANNPHRKFG